MPWPLAVGVIATLIYLAIQIRQNTSATRAGVRQGVTEQANQYISMGLDNRVVAKARTKQQLRSLSGISATIYAACMVLLFNFWRRVFKKP